ncbi:MAG: hypothetical protein KatS3mg029_0569 [Saprospiraceae bacterium]|nr:MAG: hypothetical protein KatS3mg029_0569 [Saprospiraceae bacterium]
MMTLRNMPSATSQRARFSPEIFSPTLDTLFQDCPIEQFKRGAAIFNGAETQRNVYRVEKGVVKILYHTHGVDLLDDYCLPGNLLNVGALIDSVPPECMAVAVSYETRVRSLPIAKLKGTLGMHPELYPALMRQLLDGQERRRERLFRLVHLRAEDRIVHVLLELVQRYGRPAGLEFVIKPMLTHQELGEIAGTGRQTVTTVLNKLRRKGLLHFNRQYLLVRSLHDLKACLDG